MMRLIIIVAALSIGGIAAAESAEKVNEAPADSIEESPSEEISFMGRLKAAGAENSVESRRRVLLELHNWNLANFFGVGEEAKFVAEEAAAQEKLAGDAEHSETPEAE